jgi:TRAP-type transport system periplasmic protein
MKRSMLVCFAGLALAASVPAAAQHVMKIGNATINDVQHEWQKRFAARVNQKSGGKMKVEVYPASQLGPQPQMINGVQLATIEALIIPPEFLVGVDSRYQVVGAPGLVKSWQHAYKLTQDEAVRKLMFGLGQKQGLRGVGMIVHGPTMVATKEPMRTLDAFHGKKIRTLPSPMATEPIKRLGGAPIPMPLSEALPALLTGVVDGIYGGLTVFNAFKYHEGAKFVTATEWAWALPVTVVSEIWFQKLPAELQRLVLAEAAGVEKDLFDWVVAENEAAARVWTKNGGTLIQLSTADKQRMFKVVSPIGAEVFAGNPALNETYKVLKARAEALE